MAAAAINRAKELKTAGAKIYTIGVMEGADPNDRNRNINKYMNAVSSNYPTASATWKKHLLSSEINITWGDRAEGSSYYKATSNASELTNIFGEISTEITSGVEADDTSVLTDTISEYFVPSGITAAADGKVNSGVKVSKVAASGTGAAPAWGTPEEITDPVAVTLEGKTIKVTGFNYSDKGNLVVNKNGNWQGYKLQLEFNIAADTACTTWQSGTHYYPTNVAGANNAENAGLAYGENGKTELTESPEVAVTAYSVTYNGNGNDGGNAVTDAKAYIPGATVTVQKNTFTKTGYQFTAWNTQANGEGTAYTETTDTFTMANENVTLYAQWAKDESATKKASYSVEYYKDGENVVGDTQTVQQDIWVGSNTLTVNKADINTKDKYAGYVFDKTDPETIPDTIADKGVIKVYYAKDENKDGIPDKYQATVTFKVVNGSWSDGDTNDQKRTVTLYEKNATTGVWTLCSEADRTINVPTGMKPATGYVENSGAWNNQAITDGKVVVAADATYTYTFNAMNQYTVTVNYLIENTTTQLKSSYSTTVSHGAAYDVTAQVPATLTYGEKNDNYVKVSSDAETGNASDNVIINVYYALDNWKDAEQTEDENDKDSLTGGDGTPDKYQALVKFESADATKGAVTGTGAVQVFTFKNAEGEYLTSGNVTPSLANVTTTPADGFAFDIWTKDKDVDSVNPEATMESVPGGTTITFKAHFAADKIGSENKPDNIPDKYQAVVTYKVVGGTWKDGKTDAQVQVFTLKTKNADGAWVEATPAPVLGETIPTGMISSYSRTASQSWDKDITKDTKVTESVTYTYTFTKGSSGGGGGSSSTHYYISLKKVDAQDGEALSGAKFGLYLDGKQIATATSDRNGIVRFSMGSSNYRSLTDKSNLYCQELTAPEGYKLSNEKIAVSKKDVSTSSSMSDKNAKTVKNSRSKTPSMLNGKDHFAYIVGYPDKTVHPQSSITRAEVATIFFRLLTEETRTANATKTNNYADVSSDKWYNQAVSTLSAMGIIKGDSRGNFNPNAPITRAEFAAIAARFDKTEDVAAASFGDVATHWAKPEISVAANNGWINGYTDGTFHPDSRITRAEAMAMINRVLQRLPESKADLLDGMIQWSDNADTSKWYYLAVQEATNSHYYELKANQHEKWTKLRENRDWTELEK